MFAKIVEQVDNLCLGGHLPVSSTTLRLWPDCRPFEDIKANRYIRRPGQIVSRRRQHRHEDERYTAPWPK